MAATTESHRRANKKWAQTAKGKAKLKAASRRWFERQPDQVRELWRKYHRKERETNPGRPYGISAAVWYGKLEEQDGRCAMRDCRTDNPGGKGSWHTDHDHITGKFRGILCNDCNLRLGWYERSLDRFAAFDEYRKEATPCPTK